MRRGMPRAVRAALAVAVVAMTAACSEGVARPAPLDRLNEACRSCRMAVSNQRFAAQIAAPGEEPLFFDDIGCLSSYVQANTALPHGAVAYVADHRTGNGCLWPRPYSPRCRDWRHQWVHT